MTLGARICEVSLFFWNEVTKEKWNFSNLLMCEGRSEAQIFAHQRMQSARRWAKGVA